jgi:hypothetical protein
VFWFLAKSQRAHSENKQNPHRVKRQGRAVMKNTLMPFLAGIGLLVILFGAARASEHADVSRSSDSGGAGIVTSAQVLGDSEPTFSDFLHLTVKSPAGS